MRAVEVAGHPKEDALAPGRWARWWSKRGDTIELFFYSVLVPADLIAVLAAFAVAMQIPRWAGAAVTEPSWSFLPVFLAVSPLWVAVFALVGLYTEAGVRNRWSEAGKVFVATAAPAMLLVVVDSLHPGSMFPVKELPVLGYLRHTQNYIHLAARGLTLFDVAPGRVERDLEQWQSICRWLDK